MRLIPTNIANDRLFQLGLLLRVFAITLLVPAVQRDWFTDFMVRTLAPPSFDPWTRFLAEGGDRLAFPYGPVMYVFHAPMVGLGMVVDWLAGLDTVFAQFGFGLSLLLADFGLLVTLQRIVGEEHSRSLVLYYWWSPIVLFVTYWHGQTDVIPTLLVALSLLLLKHKQFVWSGATLGLGIAAKLSCFAGLPFIAVFMWVNRRYRSSAAAFLTAAAAAVFAVQGPWLLRPGSRTMLLGSPEIGRAYEIAIPLLDGTAIYIMPLLYLLLIYAAWWFGRMNFELLFAFMGVSFLVILLFTPAAVGWYFWIMPFLPIFQLRAYRAGSAIALLFAFCFVAVKGVSASGAFVPIAHWNLAASFISSHPGLVSAHAISMGLTALFALGLVLASGMLRRAVADNDFYRLASRPLLIGIAGDSGTGKDTLAAALVGLFGENSVASISGDDYHRFERAGPLWRSLTHLDPRANDLSAFTRDVLSLLAGRTVRCRHYDHTTGRFTHQRNIGANEVVLVSGLHALRPEDLRERIDVGIFLNMDESLRQHLKIRRDVHERGHLLERVIESMQRRQSDYLTYVAPQAALADLIFSLQPVTADFAERATTPRGPQLRLRVRMRDQIGGVELIRVLIALSSMKVDADFSEQRGMVDIGIDGDVSAEDIAFAAGILVPHLEELLPLEPRWQDGMTGIMQLCVLIRISSKMLHRR